MTTSLRGVIGGLLTVDILSEGVHSGNASGIVPSSFRIMRMLLERIEDSRTGELLEASFKAPIPPERLEQARAAGAVLGEQVWRQFPLVLCTGNAAGPGGAPAEPMVREPAQAILNRTWRPALSVIGASGLPAPNEAGNVLRPTTALKLSLRLPPVIDAAGAAGRLKELLETDPPYGARVHFEGDWAASGWNAPPTAPWLDDALRRACRAAYGHEPAWMGEGGTIPFISMLGLKFPGVQFVVTGVLGPQSNAHGPNEFLDIAYAKKLTRVIAQVVSMAQP